ncbi:DNA-protecting protein DprA [bacterium]|nr:DNA-protecting protein DprA [bacterium]
MKRELALALNSLFYDSPRRSRQYYDVFESVAELTSAKGMLINEIQGKYQPVVKRRWDALNIDRLQNRLDTLGVMVLDLNSPHYPILMRELNDAPVVIYVKGRTDIFSKDWMSVVGTRAMTDYGQRIAAEITMGLCPYFGIVSGLAVGIDTVVHRTALAQQATTVAILGTAIDRIYPADNMGLAERICEDGAIMSEYPPGALSQPYHFPQRNRLISAMSRGVVVVEAQLKSGALSTASHAISQNRELFVVPGPIDSVASAGCNQLIRQGALCVTQVADILNEYAYLPKVPRARTPSRSPAAQDMVDLSAMTDHERAIWDQVSVSPKTIDDLVAVSGISVPIVLSVLTIFELKGWIQQLPGNRYSSVLAG